MPRLLRRRFRLPRTTGVGENPFKFPPFPMSTNSPARFTRISRPATMASLLALSALTGCSKKAGGIGDLLEKLKGGSATPVTVSGGRSGPPREIAEGEFKSFIGQPGRLCVVVFHAEWCGPCKQLKPVMETIAPDFEGTAAVARIDVDKAQSLATEYGVRSIPDVRFFRDGKQVDQFVGLPSAAEVRSKFEKNTAGLQADPAATAAPSGTIEPMKKDWRPPGIEKR